MRKAGIVLLVASVFCGAVSLGFHSMPARGAQSPSSAAKPTIYVSDFDLDVVPTSAPNQAQRPVPPAASPAQPPAAPLTAEQETRKHASELVNWMSASLLAELRKAGYSADRLRAGDGRPSSGVAIRGLYAEIDKENHWRRAVIQSSSDAGKMQAIVSVANLAKPEQALYELAQLPGNERKPGAVITLSPYVPLTKYEVDKQADQAAMQAVAARIAKDLMALLAANPAALTQ